MFVLKRNSELKHKTHFRNSGVTKQTGGFIILGCAKRTREASGMHGTASTTHMTYMVEELFVPAPLLWEWLWLLSVPVTFLGLNTVKHGSLASCKQFLLGTLTCSLLPVIIGMVSHAQVSAKSNLIFE